VTSLKYDLGCLIDAGGEKLFLVNERGEPVDNERALTIITELFLQTHPDANVIAVPVTSSGEVDLVAARHNTTVLKTRNSHLAMMESASNKSVRFVGGTKGGFIFPDFFFATDAMYSVAKILEMMAKTGKRLGDCDRDLPRLAIARREINCSWEHKGKVMRNIMHDSDGLRRDLVDGVKVYYDDAGDRISTLLIPDKERPLFHISTEARTLQAAEELATEYERKLVRWRDET